jgi:hypothetical protein
MKREKANGKAERHRGPKPLRPNKVAVRFTDEDFEMIRDAAERAGISLSLYISLSTMAAARKNLREW